MSLRYNAFGDCCGSRVLYGFLFPGNFRNEKDYLEAQLEDLEKVQKELHRGQYNYVCVINGTQYKGLKDILPKHGFELVNVARNAPNRGGATLYTYTFTHNKATSKAIVEAGLPV